MLHCRDAGFDCEAVVHGATDDEVLEQVPPHVAEVHGQQLDPATVDQLRPLIRTG